MIVKYRIIILKIQLSTTNNDNKRLYLYYNQYFSPIKHIFKIQYILIYSCVSSPFSTSNFKYRRMKVVLFNFTIININFCLLRTAVHNFPKMHIVNIMYEVQLQYFEKQQYLEIVESVKNFRRDCFVFFFFFYFLFTAYFYLRKFNLYSNNLFVLKTLQISYLFIRYFYWVSISGTNSLCRTMNIFINNITCITFFWPLIAFKKILIYRTVKNWTDLES